MRLDWWSSRCGEVWSFGYQTVTSTGILSQVNGSTTGGGADVAAYALSARTVRLPSTAHQRTFRCRSGPVREAEEDAGGIDRLRSDRDGVGAGILYPTRLAGHRLASEASSLPFQRSELQGGSRTRRCIGAGALGLVRDRWIRAWGIGFGVAEMRAFSIIARSSYLGSRV